MEDTKTMDKTYYLSHTPFSDKKLAAVSIKDENESIDILTKKTQFLTQIVSLDPMSYNEINDWLDEHLDYVIIRGEGVSSKISTI